MSGFWDSLSNINTKIKVIIGLLVSVGVLSTGIYNGVMIYEEQVQLHKEFKELKEDYTTLKESIKVLKNHIQKEKDDKTFQVGVRSDGEEIFYRDISGHLYKLYYSEQYSTNQETWYFYIKNGERVWYNF